jgi:hypothetical protein
MSEISDKVSILNRDTLRLDADAKKGDTISLSSLKNVDTLSIEELIKTKQEELVAPRVKAALDSLTYRLEVRHKDDLSALNERLYSLEKEKIDSENELKTDYQLLKKEFDNYKNGEPDRFNSLFNEEKDKLKEEIITLKTKLSTIEASEKIEREKALLLKDNEYKDKVAKVTDDYNRLKGEYDLLKMQKSMLNVKQIGEELEQRCDREYNSYATAGAFTNCAWEKANKALEGDEGKATKPDFLFRVYADQSKSLLLTSVCLEMKNEAVGSENKKKNSDHYAKLDKDRKNNDCEYALLVSELELSATDDIPVKKVEGYEKMYMVRPQYFISFLSIVYALAAKYKILLTEKEKEGELLKNKQQFLDDFNALKTKYLEKPIDSLEKDVSTILKKAGDINKYSQEIVELANNIVDDRLSEIKAKIDRFNVTRLANKLDKLEDN